MEIGTTGQWITWCTIDVVKVVIINPNFNVEGAATSLLQAMKGLGTDENKIIDVLSTHTNAERQEINKYFKQTCKQELEEYLKSELSGDFQTLAVAMCHRPRLYDAKQLRKALKGVRTSKETLMEILCTRSDTEIRDIKEEYETRYGRSLESDVRSKTSGLLQRLLVNQLAGDREDDNHVYTDLALQDAQAIYKSGQFNTDDSEISRVLLTWGYAQLRATFAAYADLVGRPLEAAVEQHASGARADVWLTIIRAATSLPRFFAQRLYDSMKGVGTDESTLIRVIVSRSEIDLPAIADEYEVLRGRSLADSIISDCSGDFKRMLLAIIA